MFCWLEYGKAWTDGGMVALLLSYQTLIYHTQVGWKPITPNGFIGSLFYSRLTTTSISLLPTTISVIIAVFTKFQPTIFSQDKRIK